VKGAHEKVLHVNKTLNSFHTQRITHHAARSTHPASRTPHATVPYAALLLSSLIRVVQLIFVIFIIFIFFYIFLYFFIFFLKSTNTKIFHLFVQALDSGLKILDLLLVVFNRLHVGINRTLAILLLRCFQGL
jgi:hypothetical protein